MARPTLSTKRLAISKANAQVVGAVGAASFVVVFCLIATKAVVTQNQYISRVTTGKEKALRQLDDNEKAYKELAASYRKFDTSTTNVIGGTIDGNDDKDGSNSKLVLDALPSAYDFPALASSIEKILNDNGMKVTSIAGTDDQLAQQANVSSSDPVEVPIPFSFSIGNADFATGFRLATTLERSIRPIHVDSLTLSGSSDNGKGTITVNAHTYYQPSKSVDIKKQVQK